MTQRSSILMSSVAMAACLIHTGASAQEVIGSAGASYHSGTAGLAFTLGEPITVTHAASDLFLTQGFHQPPDDFTTEVVAVNDPGITVAAYPNPAREQVTIAAQGWTSPMDLRLFDATGRLISTYANVGPLHTLDAMHLSAGCYTIVALAETLPVATIKLTITR